MIILGLDPGKITGWAIYESGGTKMCGTLRTESTIDGGVASDLSRALHWVLKDHDPDLCVMEAPLHPGLTKDAGKDLFGQTEKVRVTNMRNTLTTYGLRMCYLATLHSNLVPTFEVRVQTWRAGYYGQGVKPPKGTTDRRAWWKKRAVDQAELFKYTVQGDDEAEAVGIALWADAHANRLTDLGRQLAGPPYRGNDHGKDRQA